MSAGSGPSQERFSRRSILGEGAAGRVWLAEDARRPGELVALKEEVGDAPRHEESFRREFAMLARLRHPSLPEVRDFELAPGSGLARFTLEYVRGRSLSDAAQREGPSLLQRMAVESLRALAVLHAFGFVHGDLKPDNVMVRDAPKLGRRVVLLDLGLAAGLEPEEIHGARGTVPFMAPELFRNEPATPRSDFYALGATMHQAVFGTPPVEWSGDDLSGFLSRVLQSERRVLAVPEGCPRGFPLWIEQLLATDPAERPASAAEALARLDEACGTTTPPETPVDRASRLLSGRPDERAAELSRIESWLDDPEGPTLVLLCGPAGSGKSRLLRWLESEAILRGWTVTSPAETNREGIEALRARRAGVRTLALLDEVDAAEAGAAEALQGFAGEAEPGAIRAIAAIRPGVVRQPAVLRLMEDAHHGRPVARVDLPRLTAEGVRLMARRGTGEDLSEEHMRWILETSGGSAAFAEALLVEGAWARGGRDPRRIAAIAPPLGRLSVLTPSARRWMEWICVSRGALSESDLVGIAEFGASEARAAAEELQAAGLVVRRGDAVVPESRTLVDRVLEAMDPSRRRDDHALVARFVRTLRGGRSDPWLLARLEAEAGSLQAAMELSERAAATAEDTGDPAEASARWAFAAALAGRDRTRRFGFRMRQGRALQRAGLHAAASRAFGASLRLAGSDLDRLGARAALADALAQAGRFHRALAEAEGVETDAGRQGADEHRALALKVRGVVLARLGRESEALSVLEDAVEATGRSGIPALEAEALHALAACKLRLGRDDAEADFLAALDRYRLAYPDGSASPDGADLKAALGLAVLRARAGRAEEADQILERVRSGASSRGNLRLEEAAMSRMAAVALDRCRLDRAMRLATRAADLASRLGDANLVLVNRARLADAMVRCGRAGEAVALLRESLEGDVDRVEPDNVDYARMLLAGAWIETGHAGDEAPRRLLETCLEGCRRRRKHRTWAMGLVFELERRAVRGWVEPAGPIFTELEAVTTSSMEPLDAEIHVRAALARAAERLERGDPEGARRAAGSAAESSDRAGFLAYAARSRALAAEALDALGRPREAAAHRREGRGLLDEAASRIADETVRAGFLARPVYASLRADVGVAAPRDAGRLSALYGMIRALNSEADSDALVERILDLALGATRASRGMILLRDEQDVDGRGEFAVRFARNLEAETVRDAESYSRSIVQAAGSGESLLVLDAGEDERFRDVRSVSLFGIRSLMCVPLRLHGRVVGTVYLDGREEGSLFTPEDLRFVEAFADHAALALENLRTRERLERRTRELQAAAEARTEFANLVGRSPGMQRVFDLIERVAATDLPVLILGESGTGKELVARAIHFRGPRRRRTFLSENCAAIPETLLESELFGHVRGAFTGADRARPGLFEQADGGTLFLDEVGDMSPGMQARLLRVLEDGEVRRVGAERTVHVQVRVLAATNKDLRAEVAAGRFREDLFYRLQVLTVELPPLRNRPGDVPLLARRFLEAFARERGRPAPEIDDDVLDLLERHTWPGNVRELQNAVRRMSVIAPGSTIGLGAITADPALSAALLPALAPLDASRLTLEAGEREQVLKALDAAGGNRVRAARLLGVSRATLYRKLRVHRLG